MSYCHDEDAGIFPPGTRSVRLTDDDIEFLDGMIVEWFEIFGDDLRGAEFDDLRTTCEVLRTKFREAK